MVVVEVLALALLAKAGATIHGGMVAASGAAGGAGSASGAAGAGGSVVVPGICKSVSGHESAKNMK